MVENDRKLAEKLNRILRSIALEKPNRVPVTMPHREMMTKTGQVFEVTGRLEVLHHSG